MPPPGHTRQVAADRPDVQPGDVVRSIRGGGIGVVLGVVDSGYDSPFWELHIDWVADDGTRDGVGVWRPEDVVVASDDQSWAQARALGLGGPISDSRWT